MINQGAQHQHIDVIAVCLWCLADIFSDILLPPPTPRGWLRHILQPDVMILQIQKISCLYLNTEWTSILFITRCSIHQLLKTYDSMLSKVYKHDYYKPLMLSMYHYLNKELEPAIATHILNDICLRLEKRPFQRLMSEEREKPYECDSKGDSLVIRPKKLFVSCNPTLTSFYSKEILP